MNQEGRPPRSRRPRAAQGHGGELRQELIDAAGRLLAEAGNQHAVTLRGVAREVGVAAPSIYLHFADRNELLRAVLADRFDRFGDALRRASDAATDPAERLRAGCRAYVDFAQERPGAYAVLFSGILSFDEIASTAGPGRESGRARGRERERERERETIGLDTFHLLVDAVTACLEHGVIPPGDPLQLALKVWTYLHGGVGLRRAMPRFPWPPPERFVDEVLHDATGLPLAGAP